MSYKSFANDDKVVLDRFDQRKILVAGDQASPWV